MCVIPNKNRYWFHAFYGANDIKSYIVLRFVIKIPSEAQCNCFSNYHCLVLVQMQMITIIFKVLFYCFHNYLCLCFDGHTILYTKIYTTKTNGIKLSINYIFYSAITIKIYQVTIFIEFFFFN